MADLSNAQVKNYNIDGTEGGQFSVNRARTRCQLTICGRDKGIVTLRGKPAYCDVFQSFNPPLTLDLAVNRVAVIKDFTLDAIEATVDTTGPDFKVYIQQS